jgi:carbon monoxide dehydrogenase subunit G
VREAVPETARDTVWRLSPQKMAKRIDHVNLEEPAAVRAAPLSARTRAVFHSSFAAGPSAVLFHLLNGPGRAAATAAVEVAAAAAAAAAGTEVPWGSRRPPSRATRS